MADLSGWGIVLGKRRKSPFDLLKEVLSKSLITPNPNKEYVYEDSGSNVLVCGITRSGKNTGVIVPTLLSWKGSVIVVDKLFENWQLTSGYRKNELNNDVFVFDPFFEGSCKINPLEFIKLGDPHAEMEAAKAVAQVFVSYRLLNVCGKYSYSKKVFFDYEYSFWAEKIQNLIAAVILYLKYSSAEASVKDLLDFWGCDERDKLISSSEYQKNKFRKVIEADYIPQYLKYIFEEYYNNCDSATNHVGHFFRMIYMCLEAYRSPAVIKNLSTTDISYQDLLDFENEEKKPISLYLNTSIGFYEYSIEWLKFLTNFFYATLTKTEKCSDNNHKVLMILDEMPAYCDLDFCEALLPKDNKAAVLLLLTVHSLEQLRCYYFPDPQKLQKFIKLFSYKLFLQVSRATSSIHDPLTYKYVYKDTKIKGDNRSVLLTEPLDYGKSRGLQIVMKLEYYKESYWMKKCNDYRKDRKNGRYDDIYCCRG